MAKKEALGRGLGALIPQRTRTADTPGGEGILKVEVDRVIPGANQPRKRFSDASLEELATSIRENGVLQPPIVRRTGNGTFELIAGERRWRAAKLAGLEQMPVILKDAAPAETLVYALIENIQREDLNPLETAEAFEHLMRDYHLTQEEMSQKVGKDRATVANYLRILKLAPEVKSWVAEGLLSLGHAKALLATPDGHDQLLIARQVIQKGLSVRETEALARKGSLKKPKKAAGPRDPQIKSLEDRLTQKMGTRVHLKDRGKKGGSIEIEYYSLDELDRLLELFLG